jgi:hypothetical protein
MSDNMKLAKRKLSPEENIAAENIYKDATKKIEKIKNDVKNIVVVRNRIRNYVAARLLDDVVNRRYEL